MFLSLVIPVVLVADLVLVGFVVVVGSFAAGSAVVGPVAADGLIAAAVADFVVGVVAFVEVAVETASAWLRDISRFVPMILELRRLILHSIFHNPLNP